MSTRGLAWVLTPLILVAALFSSVSSVPAGEAEPKVVVKPDVAIETPRGGQTKARIATISGSVRGVTAERLTLVLNGVSLSIARTGERFETTQVLAPGWNAIRVVAGSGTARVEDQVAVFAQVPRKDLRITLKWDTPGTDIDLWVTGPDGEKINYQQKQGKAGGTLDVDVTSGYGPETYTQARLVPGTYRIQAHYYGGAGPTRVKVDVIQGEGTEQANRREFRGILIKSGEILEVGDVQVDR